jgi:hypothetical protein
MQGEVPSREEVLAEFIIREKAVRKVMDEEKLQK